MGDVFRIHSFTNDTPTSLGYEGWTANSGSVTPTVVSGGGPFGENCLQVVNTNPGQYYYIQDPDATADSRKVMSVGVWIKLAALPTTTTPFLQIFSTSGSFHLSGASAADGTLRLLYSESSGVYVDSTARIAASTWFHVQLDVFSSSTVGYFKMRINGVDNGDSGATRNTGTGNVFAVGLGGWTNGGSTTQFANLWMAHGGWKGTGIIRALHPTSDSAVLAGLTPSTGTDHFATVDDTTINLTDYNEGNAASFPLSDAYGVQDMPDTPASMVAFGVKYFNKKIGASPVVSRAISKYGPLSTDVSLGSANTVGTSTTGHQYVWNNHPDGITGAISAMSGSAARTMIEDGEFGVKLASS